MLKETVMLSIIVAVSENHVIGKDGAPMLWYLPADLRHFKEITMGHPIIMGRKTYDSISKPLPGRQNIVITRNRSAIIPGVTVVHSIEDAISASGNDSEAFIIGGGEVFRQTISMVACLYVTEVHKEFMGDVIFRVPEGWKEIEREPHSADEKNPFNYDFVRYKRV